MGISFALNLAQSNLICSAFDSVDIFERLKAIKRLPITIRIFVVSLTFGLKLSCIKRGFIPLILDRLSINYFP